MPNVQSAIMRLRDDQDLQKKYKGKVALLCHSASIDENYKHSLEIFIEIFKERVIKVFGPQHGFVTDVQDNMIESDHFVHPYFKIPIYSLYSETRVPTDEMLEDIDHLFVDLQDVGTRIYTYIYTLTHLLEKCATKDIEVIILDRPNPVGLNKVEGNILDTNFASFVGRHPLPVRHGLTMGEVALMHQKYWINDKCNLSVIKVGGLERSMNFYDTRLPFVNPSPNLATIESCFTFIGTVLFEGTNISEGRGTTRALEQIGHPKLNPWELQDHFIHFFKEHKVTGFKLRPVHFHPMFQKHANHTCGGYFIHILEHDKFNAWKFSQLFLKEFRRLYGEDFKYFTGDYEYAESLMAIDMINGTDKLRQWYENEETQSEFLDEIEKTGLSDYSEQKASISLYK